MPVIPLDPDAPWWVNAVLGYGLLLLGVWVLTRQLRREVGETKAAAKRSEVHAASAAASAEVAAVQAVPNHGSSLRDAVDRIERRQAAADTRGEALHEALGRVEMTQAEAARDLGGIRSDLRQQRQDHADLARRVTETEQAQGQVVRRVDAVERTVHDH